MNKKDLISRVTDALRENNKRKPVSVRKHTFKITDDEGNSANFVIRKRDKDVIYTVDDVSKIIDACLSVIIDAIKHGDNVNIHGFGCLGLNYRAERKTKKPNTDEWVKIDAHFVPKFYCGNELKLAAKLYELSIPDDDAEVDTSEPSPENSEIGGGS